IGVLAESYLGARASENVSHFAEVFGGRLGWVCEVSIRRAADEDDIAIQSFQQWPAQHAAGTMVCIQQNAKSASANPLHVNDAFDQRQMVGNRISKTGDVSRRSV